MKITKTFFMENTPDTGVLNTEQVARWYNVNSHWIQKLPESAIELVISAMTDFGRTYDQSLAHARAQLQFNAAGMKAIGFRPLTADTDAVQAIQALREQVFTHALSTLVDQIKRATDSVHVLTEELNGEQDDAVGTVINSQLPLVKSSLPERSRHNCNPKELELVVNNGIAAFELRKNQLLAQFPDIHERAYKEATLIYSQCRLAVSITQKGQLDADSLHITAFSAILLHAVKSITDINCTQALTYERGQPLEKTQHLLTRSSNLANVILSTRPEKSNLKYDDYVSLVNITMEKNPDLSKVQPHNLERLLANPDIAFKPEWANAFLKNGCSLPSIIRRLATAGKDSHHAIASIPSEVYAEQYADAASTLSEYPACERQVIGKQLYFAKLQHTKILRSKTIPFLAAFQAQTGTKLDRNTGRNIFNFLASPSQLEPQAKYFDQAMSKTQLHTLAHSAKGKSIFYFRDSNTGPEPLLNALRLTQKGNSQKDLLFTCQLLTGLNYMHQEKPKQDSTFASLLWNALPTLDLTEEDKLQTEHTSLSVRAALIVCIAPCDLKNRDDIYHKEQFRAPLIKWLENSTEHYPVESLFKFNGNKARRALCDRLVSDLEQPQLDAAPGL